MKSPKIRNVERIWVEVPLKTRHARHLTRENWDWGVFEVLRLDTDSDLVGYGETMVYYTWGRVPKDQVQRVIGHSPFEFLWDDALGAGLQMACWDLAGKAVGLPCHKLMGQQVRDHCPVSWWSNDMSLADWRKEIQEAVDAGYTSAKLKARPWRDFAAMIEELSQQVSTDFRFDADFNGFLLDTGRAVPYLQRLAQTPGMMIFESPIPQSDIEGNRLLRQRIARPIAMHYGAPAIDAALRGEVCDGFVVGGGAHRVSTQAAIATEMNKPLFLQMVGTGLTTAFMLHHGAVCQMANWPAISCLNIYTDDLIEQEIPVLQGYMPVPNAPGLGIEVDEVALERFSVPVGYDPEPPHNLYRVRWPSGSSMLYPVGKHGTKTTHAMPSAGVWDDFAAGNQPIFHEGVSLEILPDDGSSNWQALQRRAFATPVREG